MRATWFCKIGESEDGPLTSSQLLQLARAGLLQPHHLVRPSTSDDWSAASRVKGLFAPPQTNESETSKSSVDVVPADTERTPATSEKADWVEDRHEFGIHQFKAEFGAIHWREVFPIQAWIRDRPWSLVWVQLFTFAFCFPFIAINYYQKRNASIAEAAWAFSVYFAVLWAVFLHRCMRPEPIRKRILFGTWFFTAVLGVLTVFLISLVGLIVPGFRDLMAASHSTSLFGRLLGFTFTVGLVEEFAKALPVMWIAFRSHRYSRPITFVYLGVISGLAFGATEAIVYSVSYAAGLKASTISYSDYLVVQVLRLVSLPLLHAVWTGIYGHFVGLAAFSTVGSRPLLVVGLFMVAVLHGAYNSFASGWFGLLIAIASLFLFIGYIRSDAIAAERTLNAQK